MQQGLNLHQAGRLADAKVCYESSLQQQADNYETLQLLGALLHKLGKSGQAIDCLERSLAIKPDQAHVANTLGNVFKATGKLTEAKQQYLLSIQIKHDYLDPYINLCQLMVMQSDYESCQKLLHRATQIFSVNWQLLRIQGLVFRETDQFKDALEYFHQANKLMPNKLSILHDLGLTYRKAGQPESALTFYRKVEQLGHQSESFFHNFGNAFNDIANNVQALKYYSLVLQLNPLARDTLLNWCDLMWECGQSSMMFAAYERAIEEQSVPVEIYGDYVKKLLRTNTLDTAKRVVESMEKKFPNTGLTKTLVIALLRSQKDVAADLGNLDDIFEDTDLAIDEKLTVLEYILERGDYSYALQQMKRLQKEYPTNQWLLSVLHTCYRLNPIESELIPKLEDYILEFTISPPRNQTMDNFIEELSTYLLTYHGARKQPLEQTLHNGTQTKGNLFDDEHPLLAHIQAQYRLAVNEYKQRLAHLPEIYPSFWQDKPTYFNGSWSVALKQSGFHNHHIHPMGWLSSACYIALPNISDNNNQGYLQFGIPNLAKNGLDLPPLKEIKPEVGKLVLFPSMLWHGTVPFDENSIRLSIACDISYAE